MKKVLLVTGPQILSPKIPLVHKIGIKNGYFLLDRVLFGAGAGSRSSLNTQGLMLGVLDAQYTLAELNSLRESF